MSARAAAVAVSLATLAAALSAVAQGPTPAAPAAPPAPGAQPPAAAPAEPQGAATTAAAVPAEPQGAATAAVTAAAEPQGAATAAPAADASAPSRMVGLPGGSFQGAERIGVNQDFAYYRIAPFLLDVTEVTVAQYAACVRAQRCKPAGTTISTEGQSKADQKKWSAACNGERPDRADHPVNCVDWSQARDYCTWAGKRLPAEEELEWAARGASADGIYPWGEEAPGDRACWSGPPGGKRTGTCPVGSHPKGNSPEGISDLAGNVWEWTTTPDVLFPDSRGRGGAPANIVRGGGWGDTDPRNLSAGRRAKNRPQWRLADLGFRCAKSR